MAAFFANPWVWFLVAIVGFALCTVLPIWVKNPFQRKLVNWYILIPVSLVIMFYVYPMGLEMFRRMAQGDGGF